MKAGGREDGVCTTLFHRPCYQQRGLQNFSTFDTNTDTVTKTDNANTDTDTTNTGTDTTDTYTKHKCIHKKGGRAGGQAGVRAGGQAGGQAGWHAYCGCARSQAGREECRQAGLYMASFEPAEGRLQKLVYKCWNDTFLILVAPITGGKNQGLKWVNKD